RRIFNPRMVWTSVVHYLVLNDLYARLMRGLHQFTKLCMRSEVFVDRVKILWVVAVKSGARFVFLQLDLVESIVIVVPGRQPDSRDTKLFQVRQTVDNALKITAVIVELVFT